MVGKKLPFHYVCTMKGRKWKIEIIIGALLVAATIFTFTVLFNISSSIAVLYVIPVLMTLFHPGRFISAAATVLGTLFTLATLFYFKFSVAAIMDTTIAAGGIWIAFYFIIKYKTQMLSDSKNRERLHALFDYATEGIIIASQKGQIVMINPIAEKVLGYDKGELNGKQIEVLIPDRMSERHVKHREKFSHNPQPRPMGKGMELYAKKKDGTDLPVEISLSNFETSEGMFAIAFMIDISERKKSEEMLHKEKELAQMYLDIAPVIFVVIGKDEKVTLINQNGCQILGFSEQDIVGKNWFNNFVDTESREASRINFNLMMNGKISSVAPYENTIITASGQNRTMTWKNSLIRDEQARPIAALSAGEDITARKHHEALIEKANSDLKKYSDEILQLNADLEKRVQTRTEELGELVHKLEHTNSDLAIEIKERKQAEELLEKNREELKLALIKEKELSELKSRFVTMASHEFRTPLSTILSSASLISKYNEPGQDEKRFKHIDRIKSSVTNLTSILNDFLSLGKLEEGKVSCSPTSFDITELGHELVNEMKEVAKAGQQIQYGHKGSDTSVLLDKNLTRNICINLLSNAIKYSNENKSIRFITEIKDKELTIRIADQGIGIPEEEHQHIFERFFRANNASNIQGTGLGLNIVKKYVDLMQGSITFESTFGKGTTFVVILPSELTAK
ncbi:MAG: PAS domain S-box protein [Bacteroidia bacterium]|nr:PAS domain S-box protein [Bacteroidia bacterium]